MPAGSLAEQTLTALGISESAKTAMLSSTHAPIGKGGRNWITKLKPGNKGELPAYIQNIRNAIMRDGTDESTATSIAIGRCKGWAAGEGNVSPEVRAAAAKAIAEWERDKAQSHAQSGSKKVKEGALDPLTMSWPDDLDATQLGDLRVLEASDGDAEDKKDGGADEATEGPNVYCVKCKKKVAPTAAKKCPSCGMDLSKAVDSAKRVSEAIVAAL